MSHLALRCRCVWGCRCPNDATQEDGLCDWCAPSVLGGSRCPDDLAKNPKAIFDILTGQFLGLGGAGEAHVDPSRSPDACWMPNSGRTLCEQSDRSESRAD